MKKNLTNKTRFEEDRNRTINDYYRMNLDQTVDNETMMRAYEAYLSNTPGSKKALEELLNKRQEHTDRDHDGKENNEEERENEGERDKIRSRQEQHNNVEVKVN